MKLFVTILGLLAISSASFAQSQNETLGVRLSLRGCSASQLKNVMDFLSITFPDSPFIVDTSYVSSVVSFSEAGFTENDVTKDANGDIQLTAEAKERFCNVNGPKPGDRTYKENHSCITKDVTMGSMPLQYRQYLYVGPNIYITNVKETAMDAITLTEKLDQFFKSHGVGINSDIVVDNIYRTRRL